MESLEPMCQGALVVTATRGRQTLLGAVAPRIQPSSRAAASCDAGAAKRAARLPFASERAR